MAKKCNVCGEPDESELVHRNGYRRPDPICISCQRKKWAHRNRILHYAYNEDWDFLTWKWGKERMSALRKLESKMNLLVNFYNTRQKQPDHITITRKDRSVLKDQEGEVMGLVKTGDGYEFRGYKLTIETEL